MGLLGSLGTAAGFFVPGGQFLGAIGSGIDAFMASNKASQEQQNTNEWNAQQAQLNRDFQASQAKQQEDFQERMRSTQYQTAVQDMAKAGLNPMLAYSQGGAGTPSGAMGSGSQAAPAMNKISAGMSSAAQSAQAAAALQDLQMSNAQIEQVKAGTDKIRSETLDNSVNTALAVADLNNRRQSLVNLTRGGDLTFQQMLTEAARRQNIDSDTDINRVIRDQRNVELAKDTETFSADVARRKAESTLTSMEIPKAEAEAKFFNSFGPAGQVIDMLASWLGAAHSAHSLGRSLGKR